MTAVAHDNALDVPTYCHDLAAAARLAGHEMAVAPGRQRNAGLHAIASALRARTPELKAANKKDLHAAEGSGLSDAMVDRLRLTGKRIENIAASVDAIAEQPDPVGRVLDGRVLDNGIRLSRVRVPLGVVFIVFESRPNVTADAAALCLKSGNAAILRGGKEARHSNRAIHACVAAGLEAAGLPAAAVQLVGTTDRAAVSELLLLDQLIDVCIPRGGESLIRAVVEQSRIPVIKHYTGNCHVYVDASADAAMAEAICLNAKTHRTGVCNAAETILFHEVTVESGLAARVAAALLDAGVELHAGQRLLDSTPRHPQLRPATDADWAEEYLSMKCAVQVVESLDAATDHINRWGSRHTDAIVTSDLAAADRFVARVDTANAMVNCSTRFSDGQQYGLGAEIGISTDKLHARGPMGAEDLTTYQWVARGDGQVRA